MPYAENRACYNPPMFDDYFKGRDALLEQLHAALQSASTNSWRQALNGASGIGKTAIANAYFHARSNDYPHLFWVTADTDANLESAFIAIANLLNLPVQDAQNDRQRYEAAREWFGNRKNYLLVLDNLERGELLEYVFGTHGVGGRLLLTTRLDLNDVPLCNAFQEVPALNREGAVDFLFEKSGRDRSQAEEYTSAQELADLLHCQPLKLKVAAAYLQLNKAVSIRAHAAKVQNDVWNESLTLAARYGQTPTYNGIIGLLNTSVFLAPDEIPEDFASAYCHHKAALTHDCLNLLSKLALIEWNRDAHTYAIHRQLRELLTAKLSQETQHSYAQRACEIMETLYPAPNSETWQDGERLLSHVLVCADNIRRYNLKSIPAGKLLYRACLYLNQRARYNTAYAVEAVLKEKQKQLGISDLDMQQLADKALDVEGLAKALKLNNQGYDYYQKGRYAEAEPLYLQALDIRRKGLPEGHPHIATSLNNLALLYKSLGRYAEAEPLYIQALNIDRVALGENHRHYASDLNNLAELYRLQGRYEEAEPLYIQALDIQRKALPVGHLEIAGSLNNLALLYKSQGRYEEAEPLYIQALAIVRLTLGEHHPHAQTSQENLKALREEREQGKAQTKEGDIAEQPKNNIYFVTDATGQQVKVCFEPLTSKDSNALNGDDWQGARFGAVWKVWAEHDIALKLTLCNDDGKPVLGIVRLGTVQRIDGAAGSLCDSLLEASPVYRFGAAVRRYCGIGRVLVARLVVESKAQGAEGRLRIRPAEGSIPFYQRLGFISASGTPFYVLKTQKAEELLAACTPASG